MGRKPNYAKYTECGVKDKLPPVVTYKEYLRVAKAVPSDKRFVEHSKIKKEGQ